MKRILPLLALLSIWGCKKEKTPAIELPVFGTCQEVAFIDRLTRNAAGTTYTYTTSGGNTWVLDMYAKFDLTYKDYPHMKLSYWGAPSPGAIVSTNRENLNGKHIKDRLGERRTILLPDGSKLTLDGVGETGSLRWFSIHDGPISIRVNMTCGKLEFATTDPNLARELDRQEADGETCTVEKQADGSMLYLNIYTENTPGVKVEERVKLGDVDVNIPARVRDYFDDPRLGHT